ncbi:MAG TPA: ATP-binding protein [Sandaracinaceae bacterium LLY-WYZ-13_1]|nr:ATP-binding protein [Sandaracinaceae bacterium LLY-WYZ-13_1]
MADRGTDSRIRIPGIELGEELGRGASSVVYRGTRGATPCAVKVAREGGRAARWFRREAAALARVIDPGLPAVMEVGAVDGVPYLAMELVAGETLAARLRRGRLDRREALTLAAQLARTLDAVHRRGLVHRDVKPGNVVLEPGGGVRLVDLGFATAARGPLENAGTRAYAAPEQLRFPVVVDGRADLYSLGRLLLEGLTGDRALDPAALDAPLRVLLEGLVQPDPDDRYATALALREDLERLLEGEAPLGPVRLRERRPEPLALVGREVELSRLEGLWRKAREGWGAALLVRGERGSGKSRLLRELVQAPTAPGRPPLLPVVHVSCEARDPRPLACLRALFDQLARRIERSPPAEARALVDRVRATVTGDLAPITAAISPALGELLGAEPVFRRRLAAEAFGELAAEIWMRLVRALGPVLVVVDDAQWLDGNSAGVLGRIARRADELPVLLVLAARVSDGAGFGGALARELPAGLPTLDLEPLGELAVGALAFSHLGVAPPVGLVDWVVQVADGTPLGVLEVLDAMLDEGALDPRDGAWHFDRAAAERMHLPRGAVALFERRLRELPEPSRRVLEAAAVVGPAFEPALLARALAPEVDVEAVGQAIGEAHRAGLLSTLDGGVQRFVHDTVREALEGHLEEADRRRLHQRVAEALEAGGQSDSYRLAGHYAAGNPSARPGRVYEVCRAATRRALAGFDNERALRFFDAARRAAERAGLEPDAELLSDAGEAELRLGAHEASVACFEAALRRVDDPVTRAALLGRLAWAHQARPDADRAWEVLAQAFAALGERLPAESPRTAAQTLVTWGRARLPGGEGPADPATLELLCDLHYQNARLGLEYGRPARLLQSSLRAHTLARRLGPGPTLAKTQAMLGAVLTIVGVKGPGQRQIEEARALAASVNSSTIEAYCEQLAALGACFAGEFDQALAILGPLVSQRSHWLEANELATDVFNAHLIESLRGRPREAWGWVTAGIGRLARQGHVSSGLSLVAYCARATWAVLHHDASEEALRRELGVALRFDEEPHGFVRTGVWGSRARYFTERGHLGPAFEALVASFEAEGISPRGAHPVLASYYVAVAQARMHQALRAAPSERRRRVRQLRSAVRDLRAIARLPLFRAHLTVAEAALAWLEGSPRKARKLLGRAERLADEQSAPRVLFDAARLRAHALRARGKTEASRERARVAAHIARDQGAVHWERWIEEELGVHLGRERLSQRMAHSSRSPTSSRSSRRHQLQSLLNVLQAGARQLELEEEARLLVDELVASVAADRGLLVFEVAGPGSQTLVAGCTREGSSWADGTPRCRALVDSARTSGLPQIAAPPPEEAERSAPPHALAVPLWLKERVVGAVYLERDPPQGTFADEELDILLALSYQVPVALELARAIRERDRLEESLRQAQKMEAVGRFAGGIAHDFNNMLTVVITTLELLEDRSLPDDVREDLKVIESAIASAGALTKQLLTFARRQPRQSGVHDLNQVLAELGPMLRRLIGKGVDVRIELADEPAVAVLDRGMLEQALFNLALNARDAMPGGGTLQLEAEVVRLDVLAAKELPNAEPGRYVRISVADDGAGMSKEVRDSAFEPFFTTKGRGKGTGLGLSMVYGFVQQSEGSIELESEPGVGTTFRLYLPALDRPARAVEATKGPRLLPRDEAPSIDSSETILVVEDEDQVRGVLLRVLGQTGYRVLSAERPARALELASQLGDEIDLVITDVLMPEMNGPELAQAIRAHSPRSKLLFISGYTDGELRNLMDVESAPFLQKPFGPDQIRTTVRRLLET